MFLAHVMHHTAEHPDRLVDDELSAQCVDDDREYDEQAAHQHDRQQHRPQGNAQHPSERDGEECGRDTQQDDQDEDAEQRIEEGGQVVDQAEAEAIHAQGSVLLQVLCSLSDPSRRSVVVHTFRNYS